jgi:hypothetical protein
MKQERLISGQLGPMKSKIRMYKEKYIRLWEESADEVPHFSRTYTRGEQREIEKQVSQLVDRVSGRLDRYPRGEEAQERWSKEMLEDIRSSSAGLQKLTGSSLDTVLSEDFLRSSRRFIREVEGFDPRLGAADIYQALRNVWVMNALQLFFNLDIALTPSIFAYSLLYPYTDNVNDDFRLSAAEKTGLNVKLKSWLEGKRCAYGSDCEQKIYRLLQRIESQYPRPTHPQVYRGLLAIYNAQVKSLGLHNGGERLSLSAVMDIVFEKGGTSVLADGLLIEPAIDEEQQGYCFGLGTFLQLVDDLQDMEDDRASGHLTLFIRPESRRGRERLANRLLQYMRNFLDLNQRQPAAGARTMEGLIRRNCDFLIMKAIAQNRRHFSRSYVKTMERFMPVRFSFLIKKRRKIKKQTLKIDKLRLSRNTIISPLLFSLTT